MAFIFINTVVRLALLNLLVVVTLENSGRVIYMHALQHNVAEQPRRMPICIYMTMAN